MTQPRTEVSSDRSRAEACSSVTLATWASRSASASRPRPVPRSSRGRSSGSTQTSGSMSEARAKPIRSRATEPSVRSSTVISPPAASRFAPAVVSIADQPESVPPATSTRGTPSGAQTAYQRFWCS